MGWGLNAYWKIREWEGERFAPLLKRLSLANVRAWHLSALGFIFGLLGVSFLFFDHVLFIAFILLHFLFDALDGPLARYEGTVSEASSFLDPFLDRIVRIYFVIRLVYHFPSALSVQLLAVVLVVSLLYFGFNYRNMRERRYFIVLPETPLFFFAFFYLFDLGMRVAFWHGAIASVYLIGLYFYYRMK